MHTWLNILVKFFWKASYKIGFDKLVCNYIFDCVLLIIQENKLLNVFEAQIPDLARILKFAQSDKNY